MPFRYEATLDELLAEPITRLLMRRDGVSEEAIRRLMAGLSARRADQQGFWPEDQIEPG